MVWGTISLKGARQSEASGLALKPIHSGVAEILMVPAKCIGKNQSTLRRLPRSEDVTWQSATTWQKSIFNVGIKSTLRVCNLSLVRSTISGHNASHNPVKLNRRDKLGYCNQPLHLNNIQNMVSLFLKRLARLTSL